MINSANNNGEPADIVCVMDVCELILILRFKSSLPVTLLEIS